MSVRVVISDDAPFVREVLIHLLRGSEFEVVGEAIDGEDVVALCEELKPDLVIMDLVMPKKSGISATQEILKFAPSTRIVACSTESSEPMIAHAIEAGCCDFVAKPFEGKSLLKTLRAAMESASELPEETQV